MKRRLNILTLLILVAFGLRIVFNMYFNVESFSQGFKDGYEGGRRLKGQSENTHLIHREIDLVKVEDMGMQPDSLYNSISDVWMPMQIKTVIIEVTDSNMIFRVMLLFFPISVGLILASICFVVFFLKLIIAVNASKVFVPENISRLRRLGIIFVSMGILLCLGNYADYYSSRSLIDIPGYHLSAKDVFDFSYFIYALIAFLAAEIFAIGLRLQEEQELTI